MQVCVCVCVCVWVGGCVCACMCVGWGGDKEKGEEADKEVGLVGCVWQRRRNNERITSSLTADLRKVLKRYTTKAEPTGIELGSGAYGTVIELTSAGEIVAGEGV